MCGICGIPGALLGDRERGKSIHVLTLTPFYPVQDDDGQGCFVAEPLSWIEHLGIANTVLAVQPFYRGLARANNFTVPAQWNHFFALPGNLGLPSAGAFLYASILPKVRRLHQAKPVHMIHAHGAMPCGHAAALLSRELGIPFVVTVHGLDAFSIDQVKGYTRQWRRRMAQWVYRRAWRVLCISEKVRDQVTQGVTQVHATVVYNGADTQSFSPSRDEVESNNILSVGNLIPIKGHELLLQAFATMCSDFPDLSCELIGDGPERSHLTAVVAKLNLAGRVRFLGRQSRKQVADAMRRCTVFALPSRYEGLGCVYLEAMCAGKPVIACRGQGIQEVIQHGVNGWLVGINNLEELKDALSRLLQNVRLRRQIGKAAHRTIMQGFTLAHQADRLAQLYRECLV
jgi:teichuronic acid biosynthesis glycosyltransferase TuaC